MERIDRIMAHPLFVSNQKRIEKLEEDRVFCRHGLSHSLDVARILYIKVLEQGLEIPKDMIYAAALLHDIGRGMEYESGKPHHGAGAELARTVLRECGYCTEECEEIAKAIESHKERQDNSMLCKLLYEADKLSRNCFDCHAEAECYWSREKKNKGLIY